MQPIQEDQVSLNCYTFDKPSWMCATVSQIAHCFIPEEGHLNIHYHVSLRSHAVQ